MGVHWLVLILISRANGARGECGLFVWICSCVNVVLLYRVVA
jgi:hypothetical protein